MPALQVKFYRGPEASYKVASGGTQGTDTMYDSAYAGAIYYATDTKVVWVDGIKYGYDASSTGTLQGAFIGVSYVAPTSSANAKLQFTNFNGDTDEVELYKITSSTNAIDVQYNANTKAYEVGLKIASDDEVLTQDGATGLKVNIGMSYDHNNKRLRLWGRKDDSNQDIQLAEVDTTDFVRDGMIKNVSIVNADGQGKAGRFLKIEWNNDAGAHNYPDDERPAALVTYIDLADFFSVITSDSSAIKVTDYHLNFIVEHSSYLSVDNGASGKGLVFNDNAIDSQFTEIKNIAINGHTIDDSTSDSSMVLLSTEIPVGALTDRETISDTSINPSDSVELAIAKINKMLAGTSAGIQEELDRVETNIGLDANGTLPDLRDGSTYWLEDPESHDAPATLIDGIKNLDKHVHSIDVSIESMDWGPSDQEAGDFTIAVTQTNGQISASRGYIAEQTLHGYVKPTDGNLESSDSINQALNKVDDSISWHIIGGNNSGGGE
jgi:hypothetical protein